MYTVRYNFFLPFPRKVGHCTIPLFITNVLIIFPFFSEQAVHYKNTNKTDGKDANTVQNIEVCIGLWCSGYVIY